METNDEIMAEMKNILAEKIENETKAVLEKYHEACLALKMSVSINANITVTHYSGNGRRSNRPRTIAETNVRCETSGIVQWND